MAILDRSARTIFLWELVTGMALMTAGIALFTQISVDGSYATDLLPGLLLIGIGMPFAFVAISIGALAGVPDRDAGLASGINNTAFQIGGGQVEQIAALDAHAAGFVLLEVFGCRNVRAVTVFRKERFHGDRAQFHANDGMALLVQP